jgi:hypothetical protein
MKRVCGGRSMMPALQPGDAVEVVARSWSSIRPGDAVVFSGHDYEIVHRYLFKVPLAPYFIHRGDARGARVGLAHCRRIVGVAELARRAPTAGEILAGWALVLRTAARAVGSIRGALPMTKPSQGA